MFAENSHSHEKSPEKRMRVGFIDEMKYFGSVRLNSRRLISIHRRIRIGTEHGRKRLIICGLIAIQKQHQEQYWPIYY